MNKVGVVVWAIATILFVTMGILGYNKSHTKEMNTVYRCYINISPVDGYYINENTISLTRGEINKYKPGTTYDGFVISTRDATSRVVELYLDSKDNPSLKSGKISCFQ